LTDLTVLLSYGRKDDTGKQINAYESPYIFLDMKEVFAESRPI